MEIHKVRLIVIDPIDEAGANRLRQAGANDGSPEPGPEGHAVGFDREGHSFEEAVLSALDEVENAGFEVLRVEPDQLVSAADIAGRTFRSRQSISSLISGERGPGGWPRPVAGNVRSPLWRWNDVALWFNELDGSQTVDKAAAAFLAATNEILAARRALQPVDHGTREQLLSKLVVDS